MKKILLPAVLALLYVVFSNTALAGSTLHHQWTYPHAAGTHRLPESVVVPTDLSRSAYLYNLNHFVPPLSALPKNSRRAGQALNAQSTSNSTTTAPNYDEQIGSTFNQSFTALAYNVTATPQADSNGYGPAYLLNGLSDKGYWYQVGVTWNWPYSSGGYNPGFYMVYDVFSPTGQVVLPILGGGGILSFSGPVNPGDKINLELYFSGSNVVMAAYDLNTGASAAINYSSKAAKYFVGDSSGNSNSNGYFTGLMTEQYHANPYYGREQPNSYTFTSNTGLSSETLWMDQWVPTNGTVVFVECANNCSPYSFASNSSQFQFNYSNATETAGRYAFTTGNMPLAVQQPQPMRQFIPPDGFTNINSTIR